VENMTEAPTLTYKQFTDLPIATDTDLYELEKRISTMAVKAIQTQSVGKTFMNEEKNPEDLWPYSFITVKRVEILILVHATNGYRYKTNMKEFVARVFNKMCKILEKEAPDIRRQCIENRQTLISSLTNNIKAELAETILMP
jgi:hypothetical protein